MSGMFGTKSTGSRFLAWAASAVIVIAGLRAAASFLVPLVLAIFLTIIGLPVLGWLRRCRVPAPAAVAIVVLLTFGLLGLLGWVGVVSLSEIRLVLPAYLARFEEIERSAREALALRGVRLPAELFGSFMEPEQLVNLVSGLLVRAAGLVSVTFIVVLYTVFMLSEAAGFPRKLRAAIGRADADFSRFGGVVRDIQRYLAIKTVISLATGFLVGCWLWFIGVDFPLLWGTLAFVLNYIPTVGSIIAAIPGILIALLQLGVGDAALAAAGYLAVNVTFGNIIEPNVMGRGFGLSTLVVVVSLVFWGWLWGPVGMLLSVPLTVVVRIALEHTPDMRWLAVMLGNGADRGADRTGAATVPASAPAPVAAE